MNLLHQGIFVRRDCFNDCYAGMLVKMMSMRHFRSVDLCRGSGHELHEFVERVRKTANHSTRTDGVPLFCGVLTTV